MNRYFLYTITLIALALLGLFGFSLSIFSGNLQQAKENEKRYTLQTVEYIENYFQKEAYTLELSLDPNKPTLTPTEIRNRWLQNFAKASGKLEITVVDTLGLVFATTSSEVPVGSWILSSSRDSAHVDRAIFGTETIWASYTDTTKANSRLSYHPITIDKEKHILILKSPDDFMTQTRLFRRSSVTISIAFSCVLVTLLLLLHYLYRRSLEATEELQKNEQLAFLGRTSADLAHELKNPLAIIKSSAQALQRNPSEKKRELLLEFISDEVMKISDLITKILNFGKGSTIDLKQLSPYSLLTQSIKPIKEHNPHLSIAIDIPPDLTIIGDTILFNQITENLIQNAVRELKGEGTIAIQVVKEKKEIILQFLDNGSGLPESIKKKIFEPFVSGSPNGTGLGLAIVKSICQRQGWDIRHRSCSKKESFTTCFEVIIPIKE